MLFTNDHGYVPLMVSNSKSFPHSRLITWFVTIVTRRLSLVELKLFTLSKRLVNGLPLTRCITMSNTTGANSGCPNSTYVHNVPYVVQPLFFCFRDVVVFLSFLSGPLNSLFFNIRLHKQTKRHTLIQSRLKGF
jgi:hypothetical protein